MPAPWLFQILSPGRRIIGSSQSSARVLHPPSRLMGRIQSLHRLVLPLLLRRKAHHKRLLKTDCYRPSRMRSAQHHRMHAQIPRPRPPTRVPARRRLLAQATAHQPQPSMYPRRSPRRLKPTPRRQWPHKPPRPRPLARRRQRIRRPRRSLLWPLRLLPRRQLYSHLVMEETRTVGSCLTCSYFMYTHPSFLPSWRSTR
jgi:hypothetical protein